MLLYHLEMFLVGPVNHNHDWLAQNKRPLINKSANMNTTLG